MTAHWEKIGDSPALTPVLIFSCDLNYFTGLRCGSSAHEIHLMMCDIVYLIRECLEDKRANDSAVGYNTEMHVE